MNDGDAINTKIKDQVASSVPSSFDIYQSTRALGFGDGTKKVDSVLHYFETLQATNKEKLYHGNKQVSLLVPVPMSISQAFISIRHTSVDRMYVRNRPSCNE